MMMPKSVLEAAETDDVPVLRVSTKYMQTFQPVKPALGGKSLLTHLNSRGDLDIYTVGTADQVHRFRRQTGQNAPYRADSLGFAADQIFAYSEAGIDPDNPNILGLDTKGQLTLATYNAEVGIYAQRVCQPSMASQAVNRFLAVRGLNGGVYANVVLEDGLLANNFLKAGTTEWAGAEWVPVNGPDGEPVKPKTIAMCANDPVQSALFAIGANNEVLFSEESFRTSTMRVLTSSATLAAAEHLSVVADADGKLNIFASSATDGSLWWKKQKQYSTGGIQFEDWQQIASETTVRITALYAAQCFNGLLQVFAADADGRLHRAVQVGESRTSVRWRPLFPIGQSVDNAAFTIGRTSAGYAEAYTATPDGNLRRFWQSPLTQQWSEEAIDLPQSSGQLAEIETHAAEITVLDGAGLPKPFAKLSISATNLITLFVDGKSYRCSQVDTVAVTTGVDGKAVVHQRATSLAATTLFVEAPGTLAGQPMRVEPNAQLQHRLDNLTSEEILNAKDKEGRYLLKDEYRKPEYADSLRDINRASMEIAKQDEGGQPITYKFASRREAGLGFRIKSDFSALEDRAWEIDFTSGFPVYSDTTRADVDDWLAQERASLSGGEDADFSFLGIDWGEVWNGIKEGAEWVLDKLEKIVVSFVEGVGRVIFKIAGKVFEAVLEFAQQAFDFIEGVWNWLKVKLEQLYEWLAFLFNFDDFVRSAEVVSSSIRTLLDFSIVGVEHVRDVIVDGIDTMKADLEKVVDDFVAELNGKGNPSMGAYARENEPDPDQEHAADHNVFLNAYRQNYEGASPTDDTAMRAQARLDDGVETLIDALSALANNYQFEDGREAFEEAIGYFTGIGEQPDRALELLMSGVVKVVEATALFALDFARGTIITLMDLVADVIALFRDMLFAGWKIPIVSDLYELFTGKSLTLRSVDIVAYLAAVPGTLICKVITGKAPFPDQASVDRFNDLFSVARLKAKFGMELTTEEADQVSAPATVDGKAAKIAGLSIYMGAMTCRLFTDAVTGFNSAKAGLPAPGAGDAAAVQAGTAAPSLPRPPVMAGISIGLRFVSTGMTCPWLLNTELGTLSCGAGTTGFAGYIWISQVVFGPTRGAAIAWFMRGTEKASARAYTGEITLTLWGVAHVIMGVWHYLATEEADRDPLALSRSLCNWIPGQVLRFLNVPGINQQEVPMVGFGIFVVLQSLGFAGSIVCAGIEAKKASAELGEPDVPGEGRAARIPELAQ